MYTAMDAGNMRVPFIFALIVSFSGKKMAYHVLASCQILLTISDARAAALLASLIRQAQSGHEAGPTCLQEEHNAGVDLTQNMIHTCCRLCLYWQHWHHQGLHGSAPWAPAGHFASKQCNTSRLVCFMTPHACGLGEEQGLSKQCSPGW